MHLTQTGLIASLERELSNVDHWLSINKMTINTKKTEVIFFGNKAHLKKLDNKTVRYLDTPLKRKDKVKYLGVLFDEKMQWKYQIKNITQKASLKLGKIKAIASFLTPHTKKLLVNALVMPYFHYCSPAWSNAAPFRLSKINKKVVDASVFLGREDNYSIYNILDRGRNNVRSSDMTDHIIVMTGQNIASEMLSGHFTNDKYL